jgi:CPA1 family monovalent cation:H+ antiporter
VVIFELAIGLLLFGAVLSLWANRLGMPYPALLALGGAALALIPGTPQITLDPELALALFVAPVLLDAAFDASPRDLRDNFVPVLNLAVVTVLLTIAAVAFVARMLMPSMPWAVAIALGAIVAPPDASAATAVLRRLRPPHRLLVILEGESLFNDATALLIYRVAVVAAIAGTFSPGGAVLTLLLTGVGGVIAGMLLARLTIGMIRRVDDIPISTLLQFICTFAVWIIADRIGLSAIITVVAYAMSAARLTGGRMDGRHRIASYAVWDVAVFVLNALAFLLIGLQLRGIIERIAPAQWNSYVTFALAVCGTVILVRILWWMPNNAVMRWRIRRGWVHTRRPMMQPSVGSGMVVSWAGMRGIVTIAAALALPDGGDSAFPYRDLIILTAFCVVLSTLVVQGLTLGLLMKRVCLHDDDSVEREIAVARVETAKAALDALKGAEAGEALDVLRREYEARLKLGQDEATESHAERGESQLASLQQRAVDAQRAKLVDLRAREIIGDDAYHAVEEEIDLLDLTADARIRPDTRQLT